MMMDVNWIYVVIILQYIQKSCTPETNRMLNINYNAIKTSNLLFRIQATNAIKNGIFLLHKK